ncbi:MAG: NADH-quinone oxidoreductase subunit J [Gammaproteobacteria bacterium]|nr:NADH-quinone oxidoreductase subunit J [Gammaproteobacteria bacterium]
MTSIVFWLFAVVLIAAAIGVVTSRNPVYSALYLVLAFFNSAVLWILLEAEFLGITLVLVYVGAVMVLFLFVVMMLDVNVEKLKEGFTRYMPIGVLVAALVVIQIGYVVWHKKMGLELVAEPVAHPKEFSNTEALGEVLYTQYVYPFELAAVILLVAIVAAITLTMRRRPGLKAQDINKQVAADPGSRVRLVSMKAESETLPPKPGGESS